MLWKLVLLAVVLVSGLYVAGYRPHDLRQAADDLSRANAEGVSPRHSDDGGWGL